MDSIFTFCHAERVEMKSTKTYISTDDINIALTKVIVIKTNRVWVPGFI